MTVQEAKEKALDGQFVVLKDGVYLESGTVIFDDIMDRDSQLKSISKDGLYVVTNDGIFEYASDDVIQEILKGEVE